MGGFFPKDASEAYFLAIIQISWHWASQAKLGRANGDDIYTYLFLKTYPFNIILLFKKKHFTAGHGGTHLSQHSEGRGTIGSLSSRSTRSK